MLRVVNVCGGYGKKDILNNITFSVGKGEMVGILGPNGSGKTTLLKMISGLITLSSGEIFLHGRPLSSYKSKELARQMAVLPQTSDSTFPYSVKEIVLLGRYSHQHFFTTVRREDEEQIVINAMKSTDIYKYREQPFQSLSGGEQQRVLLARALAQQPQLLLLDEPTNHLDIAFQKQLLDTLKKLALEQSLSVVAILHDINMASLYCDRILLLDEGKQVALEKPNIVLKERLLQKIYKTTLYRNEHPVVPKPLITLLPKSIGKSPKNSLQQLELDHSDDRIVAKSAILMKALSTAIIGAGFRWVNTFINRKVEETYHFANAKEEFEQYLVATNQNVFETIGMVTATNLSFCSLVKVDEKDYSVKVFVTAGLCNAVDASRSPLHFNEPMKVGTINTWVFIEGHLPDVAFVQSVVTATEAKAKALQDENIIDEQTDTIATGTSSDSIVIAATQTGNVLTSGASTSPLGKAIGNGVYVATVEAIRKNKLAIKKENG